MGTNLSISIFSNGNPRRGHNFGMQKTSDLKLSQSTALGLKPKKFYFKEYIFGLISYTRQSHACVYIRHFWCHFWGLWTIPVSVIASLCLSGGCSFLRFSFFSSFMVDYEWLWLILTIMGDLFGGILDEIICFFLGSPNFSFRACAFGPKIWKNKFEKMVLDSVRLKYWHFKILLSSYGFFSWRDLRSWRVFDFFVFLH